MTTGERQAPAAPDARDGLYLGALHFDGSLSDLLPGYHRLLEQFPLETLPLHVCLATADGLTVLDCCPSRTVFEEFTGGTAFRGAIAAAGLPAPRTEPLGTVHLAHLSPEAAEQLRASR